MTNGARRAREASAGDPIVERLLTQDRRASGPAYSTPLQALEIAARMSVPEVERERSVEIVRRVRGFARAVRRRGAAFGLYVWLGAGERARAHLAHVRAERADRGVAEARRSASRTSAE